LSVLTSAALTEEYNAMVKEGELIGSTQYLMLAKKCHINQCHHNQVGLYLAMRGRWEKFLPQVFHDLRASSRE